MTKIDGTPTDPWQEPVDSAPVGPDTQAAPAPTRVARKPLAIAIAGAAVVAVAGFAFALVTLLSGGGAQPESVLPGSTIAFAKLDLDPAANQKIAFVQFISKLPSTFKGVDEQDPLASVYRSLGPKDTTWARIRPWLGDRYAVAAVPSGKTAVPVLVLAVTDESAMRAFFAKQSPKTHISVTSGYAILAERQSTLDAIAAAGTHLQDDAEFSSDMKALPGDQVAVMWADLKQAAKYSDAAGDLLGNPGTLASAGSALESMTGRLAVGLHFTSDSALLTMAGRGVKADGQQMSTSTITEDVQSLPADTLAALSFAGLGDGIKKAVAKDPTMATTIAGFGLRPADLISAFSGPVTLAALRGERGAPNIVLELTPKNTSATKAAIKRLLGPLFAGSLTTASRGGRLYVGFDAAGLGMAMGQINGSTPRLGDTELFRRSVPSSGAFVMFVNAEKAMPLLGVSGDALRLGSVGFVAKANDSAGNSSGTLMITLK